MGYVLINGQKFRTVDNGDGTLSLAVSEFDIARKSVTFTGAAGLGAVGSVTLFTVTGDVLVSHVVGKCTASLTEAGASAVMQLGVPSFTDFFQGSINATTIDADQFWDNTYAAPARAHAIPMNQSDNEALGAINQNIIITVSGQAVNGGSMEFTCFWRPLSATGLVVPA